MPGCLEGLKRRAKFCEAHRLEYSEFFIPGANVWAGECPDCEKQSALLAEANRILAGRRGELERLVADELSERGENIQSEADRMTAEYIEEARRYCVEYRSQFEDAGREHIESQLCEHYTREMQAEILSELQTEKPQVAAGG